MKGRPRELLKLTLSHKTSYPYLMSDHSGLFSQLLSMGIPLPPGGPNGLDTRQVLPRMALKGCTGKVHIPWPNNTGLCKINTACFLALPSKLWIKLVMPTRSIKESEPFLKSNLLCEAQMKSSNFREHISSSPLKGRRLHLSHLPKQKWELSADLPMKSLETSLSKHSFSSLTPFYVLNQWEPKSFGMCLMQCLILGYLPW